MKFITKNPTETKKVASALAKEILVTPRGKSAFVVALEGNLGAGKTTFVQGFARGLGIKDIPKSPTFVIMNVYPLQSAKSSPPQIFQKKNLGGQEAQSALHLIHIDCYRIASPKELVHLGIKEIFKDPKNIVVIEWAERIKSILPKDVAHIRFRLGKHTKERYLEFKMQNEK